MPRGYNNNTKKLFARLNFTKVLQCKERVKECDDDILKGKIGAQQKMR